MTNNMHKAIKILAFIVQVKRKNSNSFLLKGKNRINAKLFGMSVNTYKTYIQWAIEEGYLIEEPAGYRAKDFFTIVKHFCWKNDLQLQNHRILRKKTINFKTVLKELEIILYHDTLLVPQFKYAVLDQKLRSVKKRQTINAAAGEDDHEKREILSSVRQISNKFGFGHGKSSAIMKARTHLYSHRINHKFVKGCTLVNIERLKQEYPNATIIPHPNSNSIKVCFGTVMTCNRMRKGYISRGKRIGESQMILIAERLQKHKKGLERGFFGGFTNDQVVSMMFPGGILSKKELFKGILSKKWDVPLISAGGAIAK